jgi:TolA-binding protein
MKVTDFDSSLSEARTKIEEIRNVNNTDQNINQLDGRICKIENSINKLDTDTKQSKRRHQRKEYQVTLWFADAISGLRDINARC